MTHKLLNTIILAAEVTKGMKSVGSKALLELNKQSILDHQIHYLNRYYHGNTICVATGFEHDKIKKRTNKYHNVDCCFNQHYESTNHGKSLDLYLQNHDPKNLLLITNGVLIYNKLIIPDYSVIYGLKKTKPGFNIGFNKANDKVYYVFYDLPNIWSECVFLDHNAIQSLKNLTINRNISQLFLFEILNLLIDENIHISYSILPQKDIIKINNHKDLYKLKNYEKNIYTKNQ